ncbi:MULTISPECIES: SDR family oxidoreductase [Paenibacillus]|uniref:SDR family oxidoreductase n=1 Tax=Paenibacillus TaxID=44249 RepID=UPI002042008A|nr:SDR family NAD(P)-dependent oxidoreductase [Paenibacillus camelliae]MCM3634788.1 SDR family NAD(P)-dependent oxidoreductase [Paenibacillus camelliae]
MNRSGHTVLITGGAAGIGQALTEKFISTHNEVIIVGRNEQKLKMMKQRYAAISTYTCNLNDNEQVKQLAEQVIHNHPRLSVLINNAGIQYNYSLAGNELYDAQIEAEIMTNLTSPILLTAQLIPLLRQQKQAAIVNVSSALGFVPKQSAPVYCATKGGLHIFTKALRYQLESTPIKVFEIIPPIVETDMTKGRGHGKISPYELAEQFFRYYEQDRFEAPIGKSKWLSLINRILPTLAERMLRNS